MASHLDDQGQISEPEGCDSISGVAKQRKITKLDDQGQDHNTREEPDDKKDAKSPGIHVPDVVDRDVLIVVAGKSGAGKSTLINTILNIEEDIELSLESTTQACSTKQISQNGITIQIVDTPGMGGNMVKQLKALTEYTQKNADLLVYCFSITPGSKFNDEEKGIMQAIQDVYGTDIWKYCLLVFTFGNVARARYQSKRLTLPDESIPNYKKYVEACAEKFRMQFRALKVEDINVKTIFQEQSESLDGTIIAIPAGYDDDDSVLPDIVPEGDVEGWKGRVFLEMLKKCRDNHKEALLEFRYGQKLVRKELRKIILGSAEGGAGVAVAAGAGTVAGIAGGPPGMIAGGMLGAAVGIVAVVTFKGVAVGIKKLKEKKKID